MLTFPKSTHRLYFFQASNSFYVADLDKSRTIKLSKCAWEFLSLYQGQKHTIEEVREKLSAQYSPKEIDAVIEEVENLHQNGLIFDNDDWSVQWKTAWTSRRPCLFIPQEVKLWFCEVDQLTAGTNMALHHMVKNLAQWNRC